MSEERFSEVLAAYLEATDAGWAPSREEILGRYPHLAGEWQTFFANEDRVGRWGETLRPDRPGGAAAAKTLLETSPLESLPWSGGRHFGDYELLEEIARGGMGVVYKARQKSLNRVVALKMILTGRLASAAEVQRFRLEAEAAAGLDHPHIVPIYEVGDHHGQHYFTMKFIEGRDLAKTLRQGWTQGDSRRALPEMVRLLATVARAVHYAHERGILHRDLKPSNILLDNDGVPHISDFGLARRLEGDARLTQSGAIVGTPSYMPPEQALGKKAALTTATDVYSLGAILYELLTDRPPFQAESALETVLEVLDKKPLPPRCANPTIDADIELVCLKCLDKEPSRRYPSAAALAEELERWSRGEPIQGRRAGPFERLWHWGRRNPVVAALAGAVALTLFVGTVLTAFFAVRAGREADQAREAKLLGDRRLYAAHMTLAGRAWEDNQIPRLRELLDGQRPERTGGPDQRGFEWYYWQRLCVPELLSFQADPFDVNDIDYSPDGGMLATAGGNGIKLWDADSGHPKFTLEGEVGGVSGVTFSPDGKLLASAGEDGLVQVWDLAARQATLVLQEGKAVSGVFRVAFAPDGERLAFTSWDQTVKVWDLVNRREAHTFPETTGSRLAFSPDGKHLAATHQDRVKVWNLADGRLARTLRSVNADTFPVVPVRALAFSPDGKVLASGSEEGTVHLWNLAGEGELPVLRGHARRVGGLSFSPDGRQVASASEDGSVKVWDVATGQERLSLKGHTKGVTGVAFHPDGRRLASAGRDGAVKVWAAGGGQRVLSVKDSRDGVQGVAFSPDGRRLVTAGGDKTLRLWDAASGKQERSLKGHTEAVRRAVVSPDGRRLASAGWDRTVRVWDAASGKEVLTLPERDHFAYAVAFSPDGTSLATCGNEKTVSVWSMTTGEELLGLRGHADAVFDVAFSPDGTRLASASADKTVRLWDARSGHEVLTIHGDTGFHGVAFGPDGRWLAAAGDKVVRVWDTVTGGEKLTLRGHGNLVWAVAVTPDGQRLASASSDGTVKIWDAITGDETLTLKGHTDEVLSLAFSPDGRRLASASSDGTVKIWDATPPDGR